MFIILTKCFNNLIQNKWKILKKKQNLSLCTMGHYGNYFKLNFKEFLKGLDSHCYYLT